MDLCEVLYLQNIMSHEHYVDISGTERLEPRFRDPEALSLTRLITRPTGDVTQADLDKLALDFVTLDLLSDDEFYIKNLYEFVYLMSLTPVIVTAHSEFDYDSGNGVFVLCSRCVTYNPLDWTRPLRSGLKLYERFVQEKTLPLEDRWTCTTELCFAIFLGITYHRVVDLRRKYTNYNFEDLSTSLKRSVLATVGGI